MTRFEFKMTAFHFFYFVLASFTSNLFETERQLNVTFENDLFYGLSFAFGGNWSLGRGLLLLINWCRVHLKWWCK